MSEQQQVTINGETFTEEDVEILTALLKVVKRADAREEEVGLLAFYGPRLGDLANRLARAMGLESEGVREE